MDAPVPLHSLLVPSELKCPLSNRLFVDPVVAGTSLKPQSVYVCGPALDERLSALLKTASWSQDSRNIVK